ncbi:hypothetical protein Pfo_014289 [Paulownia fortunei]|nr:hypothetical protein Pfo_014289 [Paulownia fortunei]
MALDYSQFLRDKFQDDLEEADREMGQDLPLRTELKETLEYIQKEEKFQRPSVLIKMKDIFKKLNDVLAECIMFAENRPRKALIGGTSRKILPGSRPCKDYWFMIKTWRSLQSIRREMESAKSDSGEADDQEKIYPFVYYITGKEIDAKKENCHFYGNHERYHGLDEQAKKIIDSLQNGKLAIGIVGMGGSGKTILARKIFHEMRQRFQVMLWINLTEFTDPKIDTVRIEYNVTTSTRLFFSEVKKELEKYRRHGRKCMVVVDGVWHATGEIKELTGLVLRRGGEIIVISRLEGVVKGILSDQGNFYLHRMEPVSPDNCWRIFEDSIGRKLLTTSDGEPMSLEKTQVFSEMKDEIMEQCDGLPLAAKALAEVISFGLGKKDFWTDSNVRKNIILRVEADSPILTSLAHKLFLEGAGCEVENSYNSGGLRVDTYMDPRQVVKELGPFHHAELISVLNHDA